jgi:hypothetical protein
VTGIARTSTSTYLATASGNVGIGTTSPADFIDATSGVAIIAPSGRSGLSLGSTQGTADEILARLSFTNTNSTNAGSKRLSYISGIRGTTNNSAYLEFGTANDGLGTQRMVISQTGNVGIGTSSPVEKLEVVRTTGAGVYIKIQDTVGSNYVGTESGNLVFLNGSASEKMRITSGGNVVVGSSTEYGYKIALKTNSTSDVDGLMYMLNSANSASIYMFCATNTFMNTSDATIWMKRNGTTSRSINASGTINASGADYAEYMVKEITDDIAKGDIVGVNSNGKLTNIFADSVSFVIKSTDPSYVGGDTWFNVEPPLEKDFKTKNEFEIAYEEFKVKREEARAKVDRIAFSGQIPCNVLGANVGDYIIPINDNGKIKGQAISNPTFEQYQNSIAKVWKIMEDGRAWVAVKIG